MAGKLAAARGPGTRSLSPRRPAALHRLHFPTAASAERSHKGSEWPVSGAAAVLVWVVGGSAAFLHYGGHPIPVAQPSGRIITPLMLDPSFAYISRAP